MPSDVQLRIQQLRETEQRFQWYIGIDWWMLALNVCFAAYGLYRLRAGDVSELQSWVLALNFIAVFVICASMRNSRQGLLESRRLRLYLERVILVGSMKVGDCAKLYGLKLDTTWNGEVCEILTDELVNSVPEKDGVERLAARRGIRMLRTGITGYARLEHLMPVEGDVRSWAIHYTGEEPQ